MTPANGTMQWAVSQADPFRRMHIKGDIVLHQNGGYASGGWMSDDLIDGNVSRARSSSGSRETPSGAVGTARTGTWSSSATSIRRRATGRLRPSPESPQVPIVREKPFLRSMPPGTTASAFRRCGRTARVSHGAAGRRPGKTIPLSRFYIARPDIDTAATINAQLAKGKNLLFTPGIYHLDRHHQSHQGQHRGAGAGLRHPGGGQRRHGHDHRGRGRHHHRRAVLRRGS